MATDTDPMATMQRRIKHLEEENERLTGWKDHIAQAPSDECEKDAIDLFAEGERIKPLIDSWKKEVARLEGELNDAVGHSTEEERLKFVEMTKAINLEDELCRVKDILRTLRYWLEIDPEDFANKQALDIVNNQLSAWVGRHDHDKPAANGE